MHKKRGSSSPGFIIFLMVFLVSTCLMVEIYNMYSTKDAAQTLLTRATNVAIENSYRRDLIQASGAALGTAVVGVDSKKAEQSFYEYLINAGVEFNHSGTLGTAKNKDGVSVWVLEIKDIEIDDGLVFNSDGTLDFMRSADTDGPYFTVEAVVRRNPIFMLTFLEDCDPTKDYTIKIPLAVKSRSRKESYRN